MALIKCYECGNDVSDQAVTCPKCGATLRERRESKAEGGCLLLFVILFLIGGVLSLCGCGIPI